MAKEYSPDVVAQSFIKQFYEMLAENPSELHRFYMAESFFTHCEGQQTTPAVQGAEAIRAKVAELQLAGARVDLSEGSVDAQRSDINGVFMVVTGEFTQPSKSLEPKKFVQTFFLASQAPTGQAASMASYFVRNSVFRLLNGSTTVPSVSVSVQASAAVPKVADASTATSATTTSSASTSTAEPEAKVAVVPVPAPVVHVVVPASEVAVVAAPSVVAPVPVPVPVEVAPLKPEAPVIIVSAPEVPAAPSAPRSYSDMARAAASSSNLPASPTRFATRPPSARPFSSAPKAAETSKAPSAAATPSNSVYVKQVPEVATEQEVLTLFTRFGPVKRVELNSQRGFAFVDYETATSVQVCLASCKESALELLGAALKVEERNSRGAGGGSGSNSSGPRNKSNVRRDGERREGGGRGGGREGGDKERRDKDRRGPKSENNGASNGSAGVKSAPAAGEATSARAPRK